MKPRIISMTQKPEPDAPSLHHLSPLLVDPGYRNLLQSIMRFLPIRDRTSLAQVNRVNRYVANSCLDRELHDPLAVLHILTQLDKYEIAKFVQQFFHQESDYYQTLHKLSSPAADALRALVTPLFFLKKAPIDQAVKWLQENEFPAHLVHSVRMVSHALIYPDVYFRKGLRGDWQCFLNLQCYDFTNVGALHGGGKVIDVNLGGANLSHARLENLHFLRCNFLSATLTHAKMQHTIAHDNDFSFANLQYADLRHANLSHASLHHADLRFANAPYVDFSFCNASGIQLQGANLDMANFTHANLPDAHLHRGNLTCANLQFASLPNADLSQTTALGTNILFADLNRTNRELMQGLMLWGQYAKLSNQPAAEPAVKRYKV